MIIRDGYTIQGSFESPATGTVKFSYRHAHPSRMFDYHDSVKRAGEGERFRLCAEVLKEHLVTWDVEMETGPGEYAPAPINEITLGKIPFPLFDKMFDAVAGYGMDALPGRIKNS